MSKIRIFLIFLLFPPSLLAKTTSDFNFSGDISYFSNNISRGISQTGDKPSLQSNLKIAKEEGEHFRIGVTQFDNRVNPDTKESVEISYDAGYKSQFEDFAIDIGLIYYQYPGSVHYVNYNFFEGYLDISSKYQDLEFGNVVFLSDNNFNDSGKSLYYNIYAKYQIKPKLSLKSALGYQKIEKGVPYGSSDALDWLIGFDYDLLKNVTFQLFYSGNDIDDDFCNEVCGEAIVTSLTFKI